MSGRSTEGSRAPQQVTDHRRQHMAYSTEFVRTTMLRREVKVGQYSGSGQRSGNQRVAERVLVGSRAVTSGQQGGQ